MSDAKVSAGFRTRQPVIRNTRLIFFFEEKNIVLEELVRDSKGFEIARSDITRCDCIHDQRCQGAAVVPHAGPNSSEPHKFKRNNSLA